MKTSVLTRHQVKTMSCNYMENRVNYLLVVEIRYDDECENGHNSFSVTGSTYRANKDGSRNRNYRDCINGGCIHDTIAKHFPALKRAIKFHLCDSTGPMYYIENTLYHIKQGDLDAARSCAIWPDATDAELTAPDIVERLNKRLPALMAEFIETVELFGFTF